MSVPGPDLPETADRRWVTLVAVASAAIYYFAFTRRWPLGDLVDRPYLDYAWLSQYTRAGQVAYLGSFLALFALQYVALRLARANPGAAPLGLILGAQTCFGLFLAFIYPVAALDVYDYLMYGRISLVYGGNPFTQPPAAFPDRLAGFSPWPGEASVYGPIWQIISLVPTALAGDDLFHGLLAFKLLALASYVGCAALIWSLSRLVDPPSAPAGTLLFAWNPLLHFELAGNGHNDGAMLLLVLLGVTVLVRGPRVLVGPVVAGAVLTKLLAVALAPVFLAGLLRADGSWQARMRWIVGGGLLAAALTVAAYAPFWEGTRTLHFLTRGNWFTASFPTMLREYFRRWMQFEDAGRLAAALVGLGFALYVAYRLLAFWRQTRQSSDRPCWHAWLAAAHDTTFTYLAFGCLWWEPWYLTWLVGLAALTADRLAQDRALLFSFGGVINYVVFKYIWPVFQPMTYTEIMGISVVAIFGLPLLHLACTAPRR